jgi:hypothetical protein
MWKSEGEVVLWVEIVGWVAGAVLSSIFREELDMAVVVVVVSLMSGSDMTGESSVALYSKES